MMRRGRGTRRGLAVAVPILAVVMSLATVAWACTVNMMGSIWFTSYVNNACTNSTVTSGSAGSTWCSQAAGLTISDARSPGAKYELRYAGNVNDCHNSMNKIKNNDSVDGLFTAGGTYGGWTNQRITLPSSGSYVVCAATPAAFDPLNAGVVETGWWSADHVTITVT